MDVLINSLQNNHGDALPGNIGDLQGMVRAIQASLLHLDTDEHPRHQLCPTGENSRCVW